MTVETTIQRMYDEYPDLFATRQECYNHLFCVIGNGYEWKRGQLIRVDEADPRSDAYDPEAEERDYLSYPPMAVQSEENIQKHDEQMNVVIERLKLAPSPKWYPLCEYSKINSVPPDVKPDWKAAAEECKRMLEADGVKVDQCTTP